MDVSLDGKRRPLGVLGIQPLTRIGPVRGSHHSERIPEEERESFRWNQLVQRVGELLRDRVSTVHVMDSEADSYALFWRMVERGDRFVVRLHHNRSVTNVAGNTTKLDTDLPTLQGWFTREVALAARGSAHRANQGRKRNLARHTRLVRLEFAAIPVTFHRPETVRQGPLELRMHVVHVREVQPPDGEEPVDWKLVTTEPIDCVADIEAIVDMYRARWLIEEFFKALKTGCAFEKRQLESLSALLNALAVLTPIACSLLLLRNLSREEPDSSAEQVLSPLQLLILQRRKSTALPPNASVRQAMLAIARLGGHIKANGDPGWLVLGRGYQKLLDLAEGARIALNM
jgi:IS4 transposase